MDIQDLVAATLRTTPTEGIVRGTIGELLSTGEILVEVGEEPPERVLCDLLQTSDQPKLLLNPGDTVMLLMPAQVEEKGCVLGKIGPYRPPETQRVVIEAETELILKCGEASVALREDGRVLTKATDIVSHAKRRNRIKGGSVQIN